MKFKFILSECYKALKGHLIITLGVIISNITALILLDSALILNSQANLIKGFWYDKVEASVYLCSSAIQTPPCNNNSITDDDKSKLLSYLKSSKYVEKYYYESQSDAYTHFKEQFKNSGLNNIITSDQFQESYRIKLHNLSHYSALYNELIKFNGIQSIQNDMEVLSPIINAINTIEYITYTIAVLIGILAIILLANMIRLAINLRVNEIKTMRLVGAHKSYITLPFICETLSTLLVSIFITIGIVLSLYFILVKYYIQNMHSVFINIVDVSTILIDSSIITFFAILVSVIASLIFIKKFLKI